MTRKVPVVMWFGTVDGEWPIQCWEAESHALTWMGNAETEGRKCRVWKATIHNPVEYERIAPEPVLVQKVSQP